jgi:hypothetical protein
MMFYDTSLEKVAYYLSVALNQPIKPLKNSLQAFGDSSLPPSVPSLLPFPPNP